MVKSDLLFILTSADHLVDVDLMQRMVDLHAPSSVHNVVFGQKGSLAIIGHIRDEKRILNFIGTQVMLARSTDQTVLFVSHNGLPVESFDELQKLTVLLRQVDAHVRRGLITRSIQNDLLIQTPNEFAFLSDFFESEIDLLTTALTPAGALNSAGVQHLRWLGDAVLQFVLVTIAFELGWTRAELNSKLQKKNLGESLCRVLDANLPEPAQSLESLIAVSFISGGFIGAAHTLTKLRLAPPRQEIASKANKNFFFSLVLPALIKLETTLKLLAGSKHDRISLTELEKARQGFLQLTGQKFNQRTNRSTYYI